MCLIMLGKDDFDSLASRWHQQQQLAQQRQQDQEQHRDCWVRIPLHLGHGRARGQYLIKQTAGNNPVYIFKTNKVAINGLKWATPVELYFKSG